MIEYSYQVLAVHRYHTEGVANVWAPNAKEAMRRVRARGLVQPGEKLEATRYGNEQRIVHHTEKHSRGRTVEHAALRQQYIDALQENARLKSPRRAAFGPVRRLPGGENHRHGPGPRPCPKCGV